MFIKLTLVFSVFLLFDDYSLQGTNAAVIESVKTIQVPQSLVEDLLKKRDDLDGLKELLSLVSSSNGTNITTYTTKSDSIRRPIKNLIGGIRNLITNLKTRIKTARTMSFNSTSKTNKPLRSKKVTKFLYILKGLHSDLEEIMKIGRELKPIWDIMKEFLKEDIINAEE